PACTCASATTSPASRSRSACAGCSSASRVCAWPFPPGRSRTTAVSGSATASTNCWSTGRRTKKGAEVSNLAETASVAVQAVTDRVDFMGDSPAWDEVNSRLLTVDTGYGFVNETLWDGDTPREGRSWQVASWTTAVVPRASGGFVVA